MNSKIRLLLLEVTGVFALILIRIWIWRKNEVVIVAIVAALASWIFRKYSKKRLGIKPHAFSKRHLAAIVVILFFAGKSVFTLYLLGTLTNPLLHFQANDVHALPKALGFYFGWAFFQQLWLNGYFAVNLKKLFRRLPHYRTLTYLAVGMLFAIIHLPNPVLVITTLIGGSYSCYFFFRTRNLYILALAHALIAIAIGYFLPTYLHHHLSIGPDF